MDNPVLEEIKEFATRKLNEAYGYCGVAECDEAAMLNSDDKAGNDIKINLTCKPE